ncbi:1137_t:CDS:2, partial [Cetraspora pellucida]
ELISLINEPLLRKLPVICGEEYKYPVLSNSVYTNKEDRQSGITLHISFILAEQFGYDVSGVQSEDIMFNRHDNQGILQFEFSRALGIIKFSHVSYWFYFILVSKREEKSSSEAYNEALDDFSKKFYILDPLLSGEAASMPNCLFHLAGIPYHRIKVISSIINIIRVLLTISSILHTNEVSIENLPYADDINARVKFLSSMYACARGCLGLVQTAEDTQLSVIMFNILYATFDNPVAFSSTLNMEDKMTEWLKNWDDGTLDRKKYTKMSDISSLGISFIIKSEEGRDLVEKEGMDASEALKHPWLINL